MKRQKRKSGFVIKRRRRQKLRRRNYKIEYLRRILRGLKRGLTRAQAGGHPGVKDLPKSSTPVPINPNDPRERALRMMKEGRSLKDSAKEVGKSRGSIRRYVYEQVDAKREGRKWKIVDRRSVEMAICTRAKFQWVTVSYGQASTIGHYWVAVSRFLATNDVSHLQSFVGKGVRDVAGKYHAFETRPNTLRRLDSAGELSFLEIYKNVS